ncbi:MAG: hypothetical protein V1725_04770 [archaeon]
MHCLFPGDKVVVLQRATTPDAEPHEYNREGILTGIRHPPNACIALANVHVTYACKECASLPMETEDIIVPNTKIIRIGRHRAKPKEPHLDDIVQITRGKFCGNLGLVVGIRKQEHVIYELINHAAYSKLDEIRQLLSQYVDSKHDAYVREECITPPEDPLQRYLFDIEVECWKEEEEQKFLMQENVTQCMQRLQDELTLYLPETDIKLVARNI